MRQGGFPELLTISNHRDYIDGLVNNILKRDIEQRFRVVHTSAFEEMSHHLLNIAPTVVVEKALQETFGFKSQHTSKNYLSYLKQAYLLVGLHKYSPKSRRRIIDEKVYPIDVALMNKRADAFAGDNLGWRLETIVYMELLRKYKRQGLDIYYFSNLGMENVISWYVKTGKRCLPYRSPMTFHPKNKKTGDCGLITGCKEYRMRESAPAD